MSLVAFLYANLLILNVFSHPVVVRAGGLYLNEKAPGIHTTYVRRRLASGVTQRLVMRAELFRRGRSRPVLRFYGICRVTYDLWDDIYVTECSFMGHSQRRTFERQASLLAYLSHMGYRRLGPASLLTSGHRYRLVVKVALNPVSRSLLRVLRYWLMEGRGDEPPNVIGRFMGSMLAVKNWKAERSWKSTSPWFGGGTP